MLDYKLFKDTLDREWGEPVFDFSRKYALVLYYKLSNRMSRRTLDIESLGAERAGYWHLMLKNVTLPLAFIGNNEVEIQHGRGHYRLGVAGPEKKDKGYKIMVYYLGQVWKLSPQLMAAIYNLKDRGQESIGYPEYKALTNIAELDLDAEAEVIIFLKGGLEIPKYLEQEGSQIQDFEYFQLKATVSREDYVKELSSIFNFTRSSRTAAKLIGKSLNYEYVECSRNLEEYIIEVMRLVIKDIRLEIVGGLVKLLKEEGIGYIVNYGGGIENGTIAGTYWEDDVVKCHMINLFTQKETNYESTDIQELPLMLDFSLKGILAKRKLSAAAGDELAYMEYFEEPEEKRKHCEFGAEIEKERKEMAEQGKIDE